MTRYTVGKRVTFPARVAVPLRDALPLPELRRDWSGVVAEDTGGRTIVVAVSVRSPHGTFEQMEYLVPRLAVTGPHRSRARLRATEPGEGDGSG
jgi:hypothetical protein